MPRRRHTALLATLLAAGLVPLSAGPSEAAPTCFGRTATIVGDGYLVGTRGPDVIVATRFAEVHALGGNDRVCGSSQVYAGPGDDRVSFGKKKIGDYLSLKGGLGDDLILFGGGRFGLVYGGKGDDDLRSGRGVQYLIGGAGRDRLAGGPGQDYLNGGPGRDRGDGGLGSDRCDHLEVSQRC